MRIKITNPLRFYCFILVFVCFCCLFTSAFLPSVRSKSDLQFETVYVNSGDTLWSIAETYKPDYINLQQFMREIKMHNGMDGAMLYEGSTLLVPMYPGNH